MVEPMMATLEIDDLSSQDFRDAVGPSKASGEPYGRLIPVIEGVDVIELRKEQMSFGRERNAKVALDYFFEDTLLPDLLKQLISKEHFKLRREKLSDKELTTLEDCSSNGTYVNGDLVGRGKKRVLLTHDIISLFKPDTKVFTYMDSSTPNSYPDDLSQLFVITNEELGRGAMGIVKLAVEKTTNSECALKIIEKKKLTENGLNETGSGSSAEHIRREIEILKSVDHPNIIRVLYVSDSPRTSYIVMERVCGGEFFDRIVRPENHGQGLGETLTRFYAYQLLRGLAYLHAKSIAHRDLKPENLLLASREDYCLVKITDFGLSKLTDGASVMKTYCGTPTYLAPEVVRSHATGPYTCAVDVWSLGVILFTSIVGYPPFAEDWQKVHGVPLQKQILTRRIQFTDVWTQRSQQAREFIEKMIMVKPEERLTAEECLQHPWLQDDTVKQRYAALIVEFEKRQPAAQRSDDEAKGDGKRKRKTEEPMEVVQEETPSEVSAVNSRPKRTK